MSFMAMGSAIYGRMSTVSYTYHHSLGTATISGTLGLYNTLATQGAPYPYFIFQRAIGLDKYVFDASDRGESLDYIFKAVSDRDYLSQAIELYEQAHAHLQDAPLTIPGYYQLRCRRDSTFPPYQDSDKFWHVGGLYRCDIWET